MRPFEIIEIFLSRLRLAFGGSKLTLTFQQVEDWEGQDEEAPTSTFAILAATKRGAATSAVARGRAQGTASAAGRAAARGAARGRASAGGRATATARGRGGRAAARGAATGATGRRRSRSGSRRSPRTRGTTSSSSSLTGRCPEG